MSVHAAHLPVALGRRRARRERTRRRARGGVPGLLLTATTSTLAIVGTVVWMARTNSAWVVAGGVALDAALLALLLAQQGSLLAEEPHPAWHPTASWVVPAVAAVALLMPFAVPDATQALVQPGATPQGTVRGFLGDVQNADGVDACRYLTPHARGLIAGPSPRTPTCELFFAAPGVRFGSRLVSSQARLDRLGYAAKAEGRDRLVTVSDGPRSMRFLLQPATAAERNAFMAPATPWRIDSSVEPLV